MRQTVSSAAQGTQALEWIRQGVSLLVEPGAVHEVRILHTARGTVSGYFDSADKLAEAVAPWDGQVPAIYITLNPVKPDLLARAHNRLREYARETTADQDILQRRWFALDFDPVRPSGISSTDAEHEAALTRAREVRDWLAGGGWPEPALIDSGNGVHLLYRIDLPNIPESSSLVEKCLESLAFQFSDEAVALDLKVGNPARIWKVPGTMACKGDPTETRPHRRSRILEVPASLVPVPLDLLEALAAAASKAEDNGHRSSGPGQAFDLDGWLTSHPLPIVSSGPWNNGRKWILNPCPWNAEHTNRAAFIVQFPSGAIAAGCHHNGCHGNGWHELRDLVEPGWRTAQRKEPEVDPDCSRWEVLDAAAYREWPVMRPRMIVKPFIAEGTIGNIAALPKVGKSITITDLLLHETHGQDWLGRFEVARPGPTVLYIAREDPAWRLKDRIEEMQTGYGFPAIPAGRLLILSRERFRLTEKAHLEWLRQTVQERRISFLVLDVLGRMLGTLDVMTQWNQAQDILEELNRDLGLTIAILDHTRKPPLGGGKASGTSPLDLKGPVERYGGADWMVMLAETDTPGRLEIYAESKDSDARPHFLIEVAPMGAGGPKLRWVADVERLAKGSREEGEANRAAVLAVFRPGERLQAGDVIGRMRQAGSEMAPRTIKGHLQGLAAMTPPRLLRDGSGRQLYYRLPEDTVQGENATLHGRPEMLPFLRS